METLCYIIIAYLILVVLYNIGRACKRYLRSQQLKRADGTITGHSFKEIVLYGLMLLFVIVTIGAGGMLLLAGSCADKEHTGE